MTPRAAGFLLIGVVAVAALSTGTASAHAFLVNNSPQAGERLTSPPETIELQFSEAIVPGSARVAVKPAHAQPATVGGLDLSTDRTRVSTPVPQLDEGVYIVTWTVLSEDAHVETGEFAFAVGTGAPNAPSSSRSQSTSWRGVTASWLLLLGLVLAIGGIASEHLVWRPLRDKDGPVVPSAPVRTALALATAGAAMQLALLSLASGERALVRIVTTRPGLLTLAQLLFVALAFVLVLARRRLTALLPLAVVVAATAWRGHSGTSAHWWVAPSNALHVALAGLWVGALTHLLLVLWRLRGARSSLRDAPQRYARMALILLPPLLALGGITALAEFNTLSEVTTTTYGRVLLVKLALVAAALLIALIARLRALNTEPPRLARLRRLVSVEGGVLLAVIAVTSLLVNLAPPRDDAASADLLGPPPVPSPALRLAERTGELSVYLAAAPDLLRVEVLGPGDEAIEPELKLSGSGPDGEPFNLYPRSCGPDCFSMEFDWRPGLTRLSATFSSDEPKGGTVEFLVPWPPQPASQAVLDRVITTMRQQEKFTLEEAVTSTGGEPPFRSFPVPGDFFASQELYAAGGVVDIGYLPAKERSTSVSFYLPGSATWYRLWFDRRHRLQRELIINSGHRIERRFNYGSTR